MSRNVGSQMDGENENFFIRQCKEQVATIS